MVCLFFICTPYAAVCLRLISKLHIYLLQQFYLFFEVVIVFLQQAKMLLNLCFLPVPIGGLLCLKNPGNGSGSIVLALGCETNQLSPSGILLQGKQSLLLQFADGRMDGLLGKTCL